MNKDEIKRQIKIELIKQDSNYRELAEMLDVTHQYLYREVNRCNEKVINDIGDLLGVNFFRNKVDVEQQKLKEAI